MSERFKKIIAIIIFILTVIGLSYLIYIFFFRPAVIGPSTIVPPTFIGGQLPGIGVGDLNQIYENVNQGLPTINQIPLEAEISDSAKGGLTKIITMAKVKLTFPRASSQGGVNYYNSSEGRFYRMSADGTISRLSDQRFYAVDKVTWSADGSQAVLEYPDGSNIVYNFNENKQYTLPKELQEFNFSKNGQQIAAEAIGQSEESNWIVTANADGSNIQFVERLGDQAANVDINWSPNNQVVALYRKNINADNQEIIFIGQNQENFQSLTTYGRGFDGQWTPQGDRLLYSVYRSDNGFRPTLWSAEANGDRIGLNNISLSLETWVDKCVVASDNQTAYCAVPNSLPAGSGLYPTLSDGSFDSFYRVDLRSGQSSMIAQPVGEQQGFSGENLFLSPDGQTLYFQDRYTGYLNSLNL